METNTRYGRDYFIYKDYEKLYGNYDIFRFLNLKELTEISEYQEWEDYKEFKEWQNSKEKLEWKNSSDYISWEKRKLYS